MTTTRHPTSRRRLFHDSDDSDSDDSNDDGQPNSRHHKTHKNSMNADRRQSYSEWASSGPTAIVPLSSSCYHDRRRYHHTHHHRRDLHGVDGAGDIAMHQQKSSSSAAKSTPRPIVRDGREFRLCGLSSFRLVPKTPPPSPSHGPIRTSNTANKELSRAATPTPRGATTSRKTITKTTDLRHSALLRQQNHQDKENGYYDDPRPRSSTSTGQEKEEQPMPPPEDEDDDVLLDDDEDNQMDWSNSPRHEDIDATAAHHQATASNKKISSNNGKPHHGEINVTPNKRHHQQKSQPTKNHHRQKNHHRRSNHTTKRSRATRGRRYGGTKNKAGRSSGPRYSCSHDSHDLAFTVRTGQALGFIEGIAFRDVFDYQQALQEEQGGDGAADDNDEHVRPRHGRVMELSGYPLPGCWNVKRPAVATAEKKRSRLLEESFVWEDEQLLVFHDSFSKLDRELLECQVVHPSLGRLPEMENQNITIPEGPRSSNIACIGSLSIVAFAGFQSYPESSAQSRSVSERFLRRRLHTTINNTEGSAALPGGELEVVALSANIKVGCSAFGGFELDNQLYKLHVYSNNTGAIVAVEVCFLSRQAHFHVESESSAAKLTEQTILEAQPEDSRVMSRLSRVSFLFGRKSPPLKRKVTLKEGVESPASKKSRSSSSSEETTTSPNDKQASAQSDPEETNDQPTSGRLPSASTGSHDTAVSQPVEDSAERKQPITSSPRLISNVKATIPGSGVNLDTKEGTLLDSGSGCQDINKNRRVFSISGHRRNGNVAGSASPLRSIVDTGVAMLEHNRRYNRDQQNDGCNNDCDLDDVFSSSSSMPREENNVDLIAVPHGVLEKNDDNNNDCDLDVFSSSSSVPGEENHDADLIAVTHVVDNIDDDGGHDHSNTTIATTTWDDVTAQLFWVPHEELTVDDIDALDWGTLGPHDDNSAFHHQLFGFQHNDDDDDECFDREEDIRRVSFVSRLKELILTLLCWLAIAGAMQTSGIANLILQNLFDHDANGDGFVPRGDQDGSGSRGSYGWLPMRMN